VNYLAHELLVFGGSSNNDSALVGIAIDVVYLADNAYERFTSKEGNLKS
jgi:hypothetical protein